MRADPPTDRSQGDGARKPMLGQMKGPTNPPAVHCPMTLKRHKTQQRYDHTGADTLPQSLACDGRILLLLGHELASGARKLAVEVGGPDDEVDALITGVLGLQNLGK